jgi:4-amino-4-deoxy-L-arabinose transferase-like glycosyltransferase
MALAVLTKSAAALMILPSLFLFTVIQRKLFFLLKNRHLYFGLFLFLLFTVSYYCHREIHNSGYISAILKEEYGKPFFVTIHEHERSFWYYFVNLFSYKFIFWVLFIPAGIVLGRKNKDSKINKMTLFASITALTYYLVISSAQTKLPWYSAPIYPFLAFLVGGAVFHIFLWIKDKENLKLKMLPYIFLGLIFITPYSMVIGKIVQQKQRTWKKESNGVSYYLRGLLHNKIENDNFTIIYEGDFTHGKFYLNSLLKQGKNISLAEPDGNIKTGETVLISQSAMKFFLEENYEIITLEEFYVHGLYKIVGKNGEYQRE